MAQTPTPSSGDIPERIEVIVPTIAELMKDQRNLLCTVEGCGKILATPPALRMHLNKAHAKYENPQEKAMFNSKYTTSSDSSAPVKKQYYCPIAGCYRSQTGSKPFPKISLLKQHYVAIHAEKKFQCSKCLSRFGMEKLRIKHEETCGVIYNCGTCGCGYTTKGALWSHAKYQKHQLPPDLVRIILINNIGRVWAEFFKQTTQTTPKELQKQQEQRLKQERQEQRKHQHHVMKQFMKQMDSDRRQSIKRKKGTPLPILPKLPVVYPVPVLSHAIPKITVTKSTQTTPVRRPRGPNKKSIPSKKFKKMVSTSIQEGGHNISMQTSASSHCMTPLSDMVPDVQSYQDSGVNTSFVSAAHIETQTSVGAYQSTHTCTQTQGDVIVRNALLSANIETQTTCSHTRLVQSSTQYSNMYSAATAETQTAHPNLSLHQGSLFDIDAMPGVNSSQTMSQVTPHPAVQTQTYSATVSSSDAQTDNWLSALYESSTNNSPGPDSPGSALTQPAGVPTQTDLSFLDMLNFSHSETQTMNSLASFMMESSSTQTPLSTPNPSSSSSTTTHLQSTEAQTHTAGSFPLQSTEAQTQMAGLAGSLPLNTSQTQTSFGDLCLGDVFLSESQSQTSPGVPFRLDESLSSSHQQTQTGSLWHQSTQTAAEKELDAALSLLNQYTQTSQTNLRNDSPRPDSLSELEFTSMHTQTMEDVLAVLDNDNQSTSVQTDFDSFGVSTENPASSSGNSGVAVQTDTLDLPTFQDLDSFAGDHRSFGVSTENQASSSGIVTSNSGVAVQTDTLDLSNFQDLDFYANSSSSSQTS
ncbi:uncharacterized protein [Amphiura filiformis]|uniref:uncharacterized protein n=1 Tax=Amphiura filiformis TaxID=82378 RepID=UPI003B227492